MNLNDDVSRVGGDPTAFNPGEVIADGAAFNPGEVIAVGDEDYDLIDEELLVEALKNVEEGHESHITLPLEGQMYDSFEEMQKSLEDYAAKSGFVVGKSCTYFDRQHKFDITVIEDCFSEIPCTQSIVKRGYFYCTIRNEELVQSLKLQNEGKGLSSLQLKQVQCTFRLPFKFCCEKKAYHFIS